MQDDTFIPVLERDLVFFDTETTGLELDKEIIEIGYVKARAGTFEVIEEGDIKIKPEHIEAASPEALEINGYDAEEWAREGVSAKEGVQKFLSVTKNALLVGHNLPFDWAHLLVLLQQLGTEPNFFYKGFDTFPMAWLLLRGDPKFVKFSLEELSAHFGIDQGRAHRAIDDARTTYRVFKKLTEMRKEQI